MSTTTPTRGLLAPDATAVYGFGGAVVAGVLAVAYPLIVLPGLLVCFVVYAIYRLTHERIELWKILVLVAMTSYILLNYGFDNLSVGGLPVGELLMLFALFLVVLGKWRHILRGAMADKMVVCLLALLVLSCAHLVLDVSRYGLYALRDASMFLEGSFLLLGIVWAQHKRSIQLLMRWLFFVLLLNMLYSYTFPLAEQIRSISPQSGVFHPVALFGNYQQSHLWVLLGTAYFLWVGPLVVHWPRWVLRVLAAAQLGGLAILQARSMYVGVAVLLLILFLLGETKKLVSLTYTVAWSAGVVVALLLAVSALGIRLQGRMGPVNFSFITDQVKTVFDVGDANARMSHDVDRAGWYEETWNHVSSSPVSLAVGVGFGQPLIDFLNEEGVAVRQPHNSSLTVLARLGFLGLLFWASFIGVAIVRYVRFLRKPTAVAGIATVMLWLFCHFIVSLLDASVQPSFEFSDGAITFFFLQGIALGLLRNQGEGGEIQFLSARTH